MNLGGPWDWIVAGFAGGLALFGLLWPVGALINWVSGQWWRNRTVSVMTVHDLSRHPQSPSAPTPDR